MATKISLDAVTIASPCNALWDAMKGDDTTRFCGQCSQYVYNLSEMTAKEAEKLILEREGKACLRFFKRADGSMMTKDCPVGWRAVQRRFVLMGGAAAAVVLATFSLFTAGVFAASIRNNGNGRVQIVNPIERVRSWLFPPPVCVMGEPAPIPRMVPAPAPVEQPPQ
jgi:hypothetical protein